MPSNVFRICLVLGPGLAYTAAALGQACGMWQSMGIPDLEPGVNGEVTAITAFDDGGGSAVYFSGRFAISGAGHEIIRDLARWGPAGWESVGPGGLRADAFAIFDSGTGPALHGGANGVWRLDGNSVAHLGPQFLVRTLAVHADSGPAQLYAGGSFAQIGGVQVNGIARWNGQEWEEVGGGVAGGSARVNAMLSYDDGSGPALYIGGNFTTAGGVVASSLARWRNGAWGAASDGLSGRFSPLPTIEALGVGPDQAIYAGGWFLVGATQSENVARWSGAQWQPLAGGITDRVQAVQTHNGHLYAATNNHRVLDSSGRLMRWDGSSWHLAFAAGAHRMWSPGVRSLAVHDDGGGEALYIGGEFGYLGDTPVNSIARMRSGQIDAPPGRPPYIYGMRVLDAGDGPALYIFGKFHKIHGQVVNNIARWRRSHPGGPGGWEAIDNGVRGVVLALDGGEVSTAQGPVLVASGIFDRAGGTTVRNISQWTASAGWVPLGEGLSAAGATTLPAGVTAVAIHDDGSGSRVYASGRFGHASGTVPVVRWDGTQWALVGQSGFASGAADVMASVGGSLYVGGLFTAIGGVQARSVAMWNGSTWSPLGSGASSVGQLIGHDLGAGLVLFVLGNFESAGGVASNGIAAWDGSSWLSLDGGLLWRSGVTMTADDGHTPAIYVAGFPAAVPGGFHFGRWDGQSWTGIQGQPPSVGPSSGPLGTIRAAWFDDGAGPALYIGGDIAGIDDLQSPALARWRPCDPCYANCDNSTIEPILNVDDFTCFINEFAAAQSLPHEEQITHYANCDNSTTAPVLNVDDFTCFINAFAAGCP